MIKYIYNNKKKEGPKMTKATIIKLYEALEQTKRIAALIAFLKSCDIKENENALPYVKFFNDFN